MPDITVVYWRDIPAQVIVGKGRKATKIHLGERFERTIDRCAMLVGAKDSGLYLDQWRKSEPRYATGEAYKLAESEAKRLNEDFNHEKLDQLVKNGGWA